MTSNAFECQLLAGEVDALKRGPWLWSTRNHGREVVKAYWKHVKAWRHAIRVRPKDCREEEIDPEDVITDRLEPLVLYESQAHSSESFRVTIFVQGTQYRCGPQCSPFSIFEQFGSSTVSWNLRSQVVEVQHCWKRGLVERLGPHGSPSSHAWVVYYYDLLAPRL